MRAALFALISFLICLPAQAEQGLMDVLGKTASVIQKDNITKIAVLEVIGAETAQQNALKKANTIAGYPIAKPLLLMSDEKSEALVGLLLNQENYSDRTKRCANSTFYGVRFTHNNSIVEFALGAPCNQILAVFNGGESTQRWGKTFSKSAAKNLINLLDCQQ